MLVVAGIAMGYLASEFLHWDKRKPPAELLSPSADVQILDLHRDDGEAPQLATLSSTKGNDLPAPSSVSGASEVKTRQEKLDELGRNAYAQALQQETDQLLAAGFSKERIQWIRERAQELETSRRTAEAEDQKRGLRVERDLAYTYDPDLDLVGEIGADEYERYRQAVGRPNSIGVTSVPPGSLAATAGLEPGDEITRYAGRRVYNMAQLNSTVRNSRPGESVVVEVLRNGQPLQIVVPNGDLGVGFRMPLPERSKIMRAGIESMGTRLE